MVVLLPDIVIFIKMTNFSRHFILDKYFSTQQYQITYIFKHFLYIFHCPTNVKFNKTCFKESLFSKVSLYYCKHTFISHSRIRPTTMGSFKMKSI